MGSGVLGERRRSASLSPDEQLPVFIEAQLLGVNEFFFQGLQLFVAQVEL
ncbi:MAG TPA: hypothetical protein VGX03_27055 [Candidatus Binatia bacterium]|nr:hypothetical protein [Candidatus Binatia bacterium]